MKSKLLTTLLIILTSLSSLAAEDCAHIFYDKSKDSDYTFGKVYSVYLQNLMGHFPKHQLIISPVESYEPGQMENCKTNFYIGSYFDNEISDAFYSDFKKTKSNFVWMGYNIWNLEVGVFESIFGYKYSHLTTLDWSKRDEADKPGFFKFYTYKGETFEKFGEFVGAPLEFRAGFEMSALNPLENSSVSQVLSEGVHSTSGEKLPYILRSKNYFYIADVPFSYINEADRYMIFSDILFDVLNEKPRHKTKKALMRIEDVHPKVLLAPLYQLTNVFREEEVPLHISIVPLFFDPLYRYARDADEEFVPMNYEPAFMNYLKDIKKDGARFIWHGSTHQYGRIENPHSGVSTDDFEFWDAVNNKPLEDDSATFVLDRLDFGQHYLRQAGIDPKIWLTPHYQASALDYLIFARVFPWNIGRVIYFNYKAKGADLKADTTSLYYTIEDQASNDRNEFFKDLEVETIGQWNGQLYPYEIYGDSYGQRLLPENLGNPQPFTSDHVVYPRSIDQIVKAAKRNLVLRDAWASLFFHPYLLTDLFNDGVGDFPGDTKPLRKLIREIKDLGYEFVDAEDFIKKNDFKIKPTIYKN